MCLYSMKCWAGGAPIALAWPENFFHSANCPSCKEPNILVPVKSNRLRDREKLQQAQELKHLGAW